MSVRGGLFACVALLAFAAYAASASAAVGFGISGPGSFAAFNGEEGSAGDAGSSYIVYVTNAALSQLGGGITPITTGSDMPQVQIPFRLPTAIAMAPDGKTAYVLSPYANTWPFALTPPSVTALAVPSDGLGPSIAVGGTPGKSAYAHPVAIALAPDGASAYASNDRPSGSTITPISLATDTAGTPTPIGSSPGPIAITPDSQTAYVVVPGGVTTISLATNTPQTTIPIAGGACGIAITPDGTTAYVTGSAGVTPIDLATNTPGTTIPLAGGACGIAITPDGTTAYVVTGTGDVTPITLATNTPGSPIQAGPNPGVIAITPDGKTAYVTNPSADTVTPITLATNTAGSAISAGANPAGIAISSTPLRQTSMSLICSPAKVVFGEPAPTCTATVTDVDQGTPVTPVGTVNFTSFLGHTYGGSPFVAYSSSCTLSGSGASASCQVNFSPTGPVRVRVVPRPNARNVQADRDVRQRRRSHVRPHKYEGHARISCDQHDG